VCHVLLTIRYTAHSKPLDGTEPSRTDDKHIGTDFVGQSDNFVLWIAFEDMDLGSHLNEKQRKKERLRVSESRKQCNQKKTRVHLHIPHAGPGAPPRASTWRWLDQIQKWTAYVPILENLGRETLELLENFWV
jgi:hypothetical protein